MKEKNHKILFALLIVFAIVLHIIFLDYSRFEHEMVRDITIAEKILNGEFVTHGLFGSLKDNAIQQSFGPLYYYFIAFSLIFTNNPYYYSLAPYVLTIILNILSVVILFLFCKEFFNLRMAFITSSLYLFSPWIFVHVFSIFTNPNFMPPFIILFIYSMFKFVIKNENKFLIYGMISLVLMTQFHLSSLLLFPVFVFYLFLKKKFKINYFVYGLLISFTLFLPFLFYNILNNQLGSIFLFLSGRYGSNILKSAMESFGMPVLYLTPYFGKYLLGNLKFNFLMNIFIIIFTALMVLLFSFAAYNFIKLLIKKDTRIKLLMIWIILPIITYTFSSKDISPHYLTILLPSQFIVLGLYFDKIMNKFKIAKFLPHIVIIANIMFILLFYNLVNENDGTSGIFGVPYKVKYELVGYIKEDSSNTEPIINYYVGNKRELNFLFGKLGLRPRINIINNIDDYTEGYLVLDRYSFYSYDKAIDMKKDEQVPVNVGKFEIYKK